MSAQVLLLPSQVEPQRALPKWVWLEQESRAQEQLQLAPVSAQVLPLPSRVELQRASPTRE